MKARRYIGILLMACLPLLVVGQDKGIGEKEQLKIQAKKEKEQAKGAKQAEKELMKHHLAIQDKKTAKRIKRNQKKSKGQKHHQGDPFWNRLFSKKR